MSERFHFVKHPYSDNFDEYNDYDNGDTSGEFDHESYWGPGPVFATCVGGTFNVYSEGGEVLIIVKKTKWKEIFNIIIIISTLPA